MEEISPLTIHGVVGQQLNSKASWVGRSLEENIRNNSLVALEMEERGNLQSEGDQPGKEVIQCASFSSQAIILDSRRA